MIQQYICIFSLFWRIKLLACLLARSKIANFCRLYYYIIIIHVSMTSASSVMILNQRRRQSLGEQHRKGVDGHLKVSFQTAFEGVESV